MNHLENACESVDASVFSSDMLFDDERRTMLKDYLCRWNRAVQQHEGAAQGLDLGAYEKTIRAMVAWLETNQPDVFKRGIWDAINAAAD